MKMFTIKKVIKIIEDQAKSLSFAAIFRMLRVCNENCAVVFASAQFSSLRLSGGICSVIAIEWRDM